VNPAAAPATLSLFKTVMALAFVLGLLFFTLWALKRFGGLRSIGGRGGRVPMHIVSTLPLGERRFLLVVEVAGHHYLLGVTSTQVTFLNELTGLPPEVNGEPPVERFASVLEKAKSLLSGGGK